MSSPLKAVRVGAVVSQPLSTENPYIIDYATKFRSDFSDVYVMAHCKFYVGDTAGIFILANLFKRPIAMVNMAPLGLCPRSPQDIFILKHYWHKSKERLLTFREIIEMGADKWLRSEYFEKAGIQLIENTSEEILAIVREMNDRMDGKWVPKEGDELLQKRFREIFPSNHPMTGFYSRVGAQFLRQHEYLLN